MKALWSELGLYRLINHHNILLHYVFFVGAKSRFLLGVSTQIVEIIHIKVNKVNNGAILPTVQWFVTIGGHAKAIIC